MLCTFVIRKSGWVNLRRDLVWHHFDTISPPQFFLILVFDTAWSIDIEFLVYSMFLSESDLSTVSCCTLELKLYTWKIDFIIWPLCAFMNCRHSHNRKTSFFSCTATNGFQCLQLPSFISFHFHFSLLFQWNLDKNNKHFTLSKTVLPHATVCIFSVCVCVCVKNYCCNSNK